MERNKFIKRLTYCGCHIQNVNDPLFDIRLYNDFQSSKEFFNHVDFNCQINDKGGCKENPYNNTCCCHNCYEHAGYLRKVVDTDITKYARVFSVKTGFWREGKGCILPRKLRSVTCLTTHCNHDKGDRGFSTMMVVIRNDLREKSRRI